MRETEAQTAPKFSNVCVLFEIKTIDWNSWLPLLSYHSPTIGCYQFFSLVFLVLSSLTSFVSFLLSPFCTIFVLSYQFLSPPFLSVTEYLFFSASVYLFFSYGVLFIFLWVDAGEKKTETTLTLRSFFVLDRARPVATVQVYACNFAFGRGCNRWIRCCFLFSRIVICMLQVQQAKMLNWRTRMVILFVG